MQIDAINIIEITNDDLLPVKSFSNDEEGLKEASTLFSKIAKENGATEEETKQFLTDQYYETGNYQLFLSVS